MRVHWTGRSSPWPRPGSFRISIICIQADKIPSEQNQESTIKEFPATHTRKLPRRPWIGLPRLGPELIVIGWVGGRDALEIP